MKEQETDRLLTRIEVNERFAIPIRFLELAPGRGEGPRFIRIGRSVLYRVSDISAWLETCTVDPIDEGKS